MRSAQLANGLRHGDYQRYRRYCTRRLRRLRAAEGLQHVTSNRGREFKARELAAEDMTNSARLCVPLLNAERAWAFFMQLKGDADLAASGEIAPLTSRARQQMRSRLHRAVEWGEKLRDLCADTADDRTMLEAEAYAAWMAGTLELERDAWAAALPRFQTAKRVYEQLASVFDLLDENGYLQERVDELDYSVKYCEYYLERGGDLPVEGSHEAAGQHLQGKIDRVLASARKQHETEAATVSWACRNVPVRSQGARLALLEARELIGALESAKDRDAELEVYQRLFRVYDAAIRELRLNASSGGRSEPPAVSGADPSRPPSALGKVDASTAQRDASDVLHYLQWCKLQTVLDRNEILLQRLLEADGKAGELGAEAQDVVRLLDRMLQSVQEVLALPGCSETPEVYTKVSGLDLKLRAQRCVQLARMYQSRAQWYEAYVLYERAVALARESTTAAHVECDARGGMCIVQALAFQAANDSGPHGASGKLAAGSLPLRDRLGVFDSSAGHLRSIEPFPPRVQPVMPTPVHIGTPANIMGLPPGVLARSSEGSRRVDAGIGAAAPDGGKEGSSTSVGGWLGSWFGKKQ